MASPDPVTITLEITEPGEEESRKVELELRVPKNPLYCSEVLSALWDGVSTERVAAAALFYCGQGRGRAVWKGLQRTNTGQVATLGAVVFGFLAERGVHPITITRLGGKAIKLCQDFAVEQGLPQEDEVAAAVDF